MSNPQFPLKEVQLTNWMLIIFISVFNILFLTLSPMPIHNVLTYTLMGAILMFIMGNVNSFLSRNMNEKLYSSKRYALSYLIGITSIFLIFPVFARLNELEWSFSDARLLVILTVSGFLINTVVMLMQNRVVVQYQKDQALLEIYQLKMANTEASNLLLKQQIHPHFLFNSLNSLKSLYRKDITKGERYLMLLADFLRASVSASHTKLSTLKEELELSENYLSMQHIRFGSALSWSVNTNDQSKLNGFVPAFSIQPLLENAIKHNELTEQHPLDIVINVSELWVEVSNKIRSKHTKEASSGSGLANLAERYKLCCDDEIQIKIEDGMFAVRLKILDHGNYHH